VQKNRQLFHYDLECEGMPTLTNFIILLEILARVIRQENKVKSIHLVEGVKLSLWVDDIILYVENLKTPLKKTIRTKKLIQESHSIQNQDTEISNFLYSNIE
jgi:hypothetical protein